MNLQKRDRKCIWHPFTQEQTENLPIPIISGKGPYLYSEDGKRYLDLISSWWVNLHGHAHPKIAEAIYRQASTLEHVIFAGFTHLPAITLCEKLSKLLPKELQKFYFSDNGSCSVEVAIKMAYQYWRNQGEAKRDLFLSFEGGYHGDTIGSMSAGKTLCFHEHFQKLLFPVHTLPFPATWIGDEEVEKKEEKAWLCLEKFLEKNAAQTAGFIAEPLLQGASGMRLCRPSFLKKVVDRLREDNILILFDEVMTGFGRTGTTFAFEQLGIIPDILCLSKGLTGGFLPLALTVVQFYIYEAFLGKEFSRAFAHGHSYTANPLGCAAACASLELLQKAKVQENLQRIQKTHQEKLFTLKKNSSKVVSPRILGTIAAFNWENSETLYTHPVMGLLKKKFLEEGLLLRPLGNTIYLLPPYCIEKEQLEEAYQKISQILETL